MMWLEFSHLVFHLLVNAYALSVEVYFEKNHQIKQQKIWQKMKQSLKNISLYNLALPFLKLKFRGPVTNACRYDRMHSAVESDRII